MASQTGGRQQSPVRGLAWQGSLYNLTLNEVQSHLGEPLHSMNLDDLLKNVFAAEGSPYLLMDVESTATQYSSAGSGDLQRQGSITMNRSLSKMTVDEVWRDIQQKKNNDGRSSNHELGEMTLEDFLMKAGVVAEGADKGSGGVGNAGFPHGPHWLHQYQQMSAVYQQQKAQQVMANCVPGRPVPQALGVGSSAILEAVFPEGQVGLPSPLVGVISDPQTPGRKRGAREDVEEKTVERRQKRMIKNRESAARSRARKQAYTNELENKISRLEEENERLRKQEELDTILYSAPPPEPKHQLRRSSSASF